MKTINIKLNDKDIKDTIKYLQNYKQSLQMKQQLLMSRLADEGFQVVIKNLAGIAYSGELLSSVRASASPTTCIISVTSDHALFVEFGTGLKGAGTYVGTVAVPYQYNVGEHIGWYMIKGSLKYGWYYYDYAGRLKFTEGMTSRPFMFNSAQEIRLNTLNRIIREVFVSD